MALTNAEKQKRWRDKRNELAKQALSRSPDPDLAREIEPHLKALTLEGKKNHMADYSPYAVLSHVIALERALFKAGVIPESRRLKEANDLRATTVVNVSTFGRPRLTRTRGRPSKKGDDDQLMVEIAEIIEAAGGLRESQRQDARGISFAAAARQALKARGIPDASIPSKIRTMRRRWEGGAWDKNTPPACSERKV